MATMVCRGLQSCLESQFIESSWTTRMAAHMKLASPSPMPPQLPQPLELALKSCFILDSNAPREIPAPEKFNYDEIICSSYYKTNDNDDQNAGEETTGDMGGWRFLQSLSNGSSDEPKAAMAKPEVYVHPLVKRSRSSLSEKSLALCTENLGNETGADFVEDGMFPEPKVESSQTRKRVKSLPRSGGNKKFPPPLTTISGLDSLRVRSHREDGRLIMEAVKAPSRHSYFQVERSHGRLRLSILKSSTANNANFDSKEENTVEEKEEEEEEINDDVNETDANGNCDEEVGRKLEENERENEYAKVVGAEIEIEKVARPCRCKEGENINIDKNNGVLLNWVATS